MRGLRSILLQLAFSEESTRAYVRLLTSGPATNTKLRTNLGLSEAALFAATKDLRLSGLVVSYRVRGQTAWHAADPATAWLGLAADATWSATSTLTPIDRLPKTGVDSVDARSSCCRAAALLALDLWTHEVPSTEESRPAHNAESLAQLAVEAVQIAKAHIRSISASPKISDAAKFWPALVAQMAAGVCYTRLTDLNELYEHGLDIVQRDVKLGVELFIGSQADLTEARGYLADRRVLVRYEPAPSGMRPTKGFMTSDRNAIARFRRRFDQLAKTAVPAATAIDRLEILAEGLRERATPLSADARDWLDQLLRVGRFSRLPIERQWSADRRQRVEHELVGSGVAQWSAYGHFVAVWPDTDELTTQLRQAHFGSLSSGP